MAKYHGFLLSGILLTSCVTAPAQKTEHIKISEYKAAAEKLSNTVYVFSADWCEPCRIAKPVVEKEAGVKGDKVVVVDVNDYRIFDELGYKSLPLFRLTKANPAKDEMFEGWDEKKFLEKYRSF